MTVEDVAAYLKVSTATVYRLVKDKKLPSGKVGKQYRFLRAEIEHAALELVGGGDQAGALGDFSKDEPISLSKDLLIQLTAHVLQVWPENPVWVPNITLKKRLEDSFGDLLQELCKQSEFSGVDGLFVELERSAIQQGKDEDSARIRASVGPVAEFLRHREHYSISERYIFSIWTEPLPLAITILGNGGSDQNCPSADLVVKKEAIEDALDSSKLLSKQIDEVLEHPETSTKLQGYTKKRIAATIALRSTVYSRDLMSSKIKEESNTQKFNILDLPHTEQRSITYYPALAADSRIGGVALMSRKPLHARTNMFVGFLVQLLLYRIRASDDMALARNFVKEHSRWHVVDIFLRRLRHDIQKPLDSLSQQLARSMEFHEQHPELSPLFTGINSQLRLFKEMLSTFSVKTIPEMAAASRKLARKQSIQDNLEDIKWMWAHQAKAKSVRIEILNNNVEQTAVYPAILVGEILSNFVSNAIRYAKTRVQMSAKIERLDSVSRKLVFTVKDDGPGLIEDASQQISEGARPVLSADNGQMSGIGLYLSSFLAKNLLDEGLIECRENKGAEFTLSFKEFAADQ